MRQKSNWIFVQLIIIGLVITALITGLFYKIYSFTFGALGDMALNRVQAACGCQIASSANNSALTGFILLLGATVILSLFIACAKIIISIIKTKKFIQSQQINFIANSTKLERVALTIGIENKIQEINTSQPLIFCHGIKNERVYISSTVVNILNFAELQAVLLHETHHLTTHEPARLLFIKYISVFGFIPGIKNLIKKYLSFSEIAADELATNNFKEKNHLAAAMAKILELEEKTIIQKELAASFFSRITDERVLTLSEDNYNPTFKADSVKAMLGITGAVIIFFIFSANINVQQAKAQETYKKSGCAEKILQIEKCENGWTKCTDKIFHENKAACQRSLKYFDKKY